MRLWFSKIFGKRSTASPFSSGLIPALSSVRPHTGGPVARKRRSLGSERLLLPGGNASNNWQTIIARLLLPTYEIFAEQWLNVNRSAQRLHVRVMILEHATELRFFGMEQEAQSDSPSNGEAQLGCGVIGDTAIHGHPLC
jgi:hypothetical protein